MRPRRELAAAGLLLLAAQLPVACSRPAAPPPVASPAATAAATGPTPLPLHVVSSGGNGGFTTLREMKNGRITESAPLTKICGTNPSRRIRSTAEIPLPSLNLASTINRSG